MMFELFLAMRYLRAKRKQAFISVITLISVLGVMVGVMALGFGLITPPYGLCLMIASKIGGITLLKSMGTILVYLGGMFAVLLAIILIPELATGLPQLIAPELLGGR